MAVAGKQADQLTLSSSDKEKSIPRQFQALDPKFSII